MIMSRWQAALWAVFKLMPSMSLSMFAPLVGVAAAGDRWCDQVLAVPYAVGESPAAVSLELLRQDYEQLQRGQSVIQTPMTLGDQQFQHGIGTHSVSHIRVRSSKPMRRFSARIGVDENIRTQGHPGSVVFVVSAGGRVIFRSEVLRGGQGGRPIDLPLDGATVFDLQVEDAGDGPACDHANWADAKIDLAAGAPVWLDQAEVVTVCERRARYPFSFTLDGKSSDTFLGEWTREDIPPADEQGIRRGGLRWTQPETGLRVEWLTVCFDEYSAAEWMLVLENTGERDTPIIADVQSLDLTVPCDTSHGQDIFLCQTNGAPSNPTDFEVERHALAPQDRRVLGGGGGRSSNKDFPFFKIQAGNTSYIVAVGWSGQWQATIERASTQCLHVQSGLEKTHFRLHPGERVRLPRMLVLRAEGDTLESNARFRRLIYEHYAARRSGERLLPVLYCNTCFTRGGGWLNECNAANQVSLIRAFAPLRLEALLTDAGWFEGGWPAGAGNWTPRKDAYPEGMGPVAAAARDHGMVYGLWFEFERVVDGTAIAREHPEWLLHSSDQSQSTYLLNLGLPAAREHLFQIVKSFMDLPGFRVYRQDFNMDPLPYWRFSDPPDRQGMTELKYIEGLYEYWDRIAGTWPDSLRIECASGGRRIDLETVRRMHVHQKSDYWFDPDVDQASIWGLSQYLPNHTFMAPVNRLDDYSFHAALCTSLCLGWIADAPDFDLDRARELADRYRRVRHLLTGAWYPLLPYTRDPDKWMASQYHRADLDHGMVVVFRHAESAYRSADLPLRGLPAATQYQLESIITGKSWQASGAELMQHFLVAIPQKKGTDLILYQALDK